MKNNKVLRLAVLTGALSLAQTGMALAHAGGHHPGWMHPLTGLDHMVAMIAVGAWSAQLGGRAIWLVPTVFVAFMAIGGLIGFELIDLPYTETGVALSVMLLGLAVAFGQQMPVLPAALAIAVFGIAHGYLHGYEMPVENNKILYMFGFLATTAALHIVGVVIGHFAIQTRIGNLILRAAGALAALYGVILLS